MAGSSNTFTDLGTLRKQYDLALEEMVQIQKQNIKLKEEIAQTKATLQKQVEETTYQSRKITSLMSAIHKLDRENKEMHLNLETKYKCSFTGPLFAS